ncbi:MAG: hypothetical protein CMO55_03630 [Verrucomicrobiales bacterium]|nr:hypothetical protein [Verrucomicrobiales bacterium]
MKQIGSILALIATSGLLFTTTSCTPTEEGALVGGAIGAAAGGAITGRSSGAAVGGVLGALTGAALAEDEAYYNHHHHHGHRGNRYGYQGPRSYNRGWGPPPPRYPW